ncbi:Squamosa promoter-binding-like protein 6 [Vitis vinifera]|uniref:Squamosa promoter-binding-like protein 6 n=1 Tax=Vitis vinifera TaxID=29760 RepID=A0A438DJ52_VITVI|nr:Squamosa promoter-binding-like protein 6 [Vitis vinifera]
MQGFSWQGRNPTNIKSGVEIAIPSLTLTAAPALFGVLFSGFSQQMKSSCIWGFKEDSLWWEVYFFLLSLCDELGSYEFCTVVMRILHHEKEFVSDATDLQPNSSARSKNVFMGWELKTPCGYGNSILVSSQQVIQNQGFGEFGIPEMVRKQLPDNSIRDVSCGKGGDGIMVNSIMVSPNVFPRDDESSSKLSSSVMESNSQDSLLIDLKLGRFADHSDSQNCKPSKANPSLPSAESSTPAKRVRAVGLNSQTAFCQVHGCNKDLSSSKDYHKRHKVCEVHSKTAKVIVNGIEQRYNMALAFGYLGFICWLSLMMGKRSCRKRLAGHNERRRKPQVGIHPGRAGRLLQSYNGIKIYLLSNWKLLEELSLCVCLGVHLLN